MKSDSKHNVFIWATTVALAGFLFGFDTAVISGADQPIQKLWNHGDLFHGNFIMSMALWGTVIGALFGDALDIRCIDHLVHALFNWEI